MTAETSTIYLLDASTNEPVEAELRDRVEQQHVDDWTRTWRPALEAALKELVEHGVPRHQLPQNRHWNWEAKIASVQGLLGHRSFCVVADRVTQGLMRVDLTRAARAAAHAGKPLVYVDYLETAPWNRAELAVSPRLRGVGMALITAAVSLSVEEGFHGRIGLHSLPQADEFYRNKCKMDDLGEDAKYQNLRYFEMTSERAGAFLAKEEG
jgi:GNAT superfamily N-acetyltransferase